MLRLAATLVLWACANASLAAPVSFDDLAKHLQYKQVKISPDGQYIAVTAIVGDRTKLAVIRLADLKGFTLETHDSGDIIDFWWASSRRLVYTEGIRDSNFDAPVADGRLLAINADGGGKASLYGYGSVSPWYGPGTLVATLPDDPEHALVSVANPDTANRDGYFAVLEKMNLTDGGMRKIDTAPVRNATFVTDHHGNVRFAYAVDNDDKVQIYERKESGWQLMPSVSAARDFPIGFNAQDTVAYFECNLPGGFGICAWDPPTEKMKTLWSDPRVAATGLALGSARDHFIGVEFENGRPGVALFDPGSSDARALVALIQRFPGESVQFVSSTRDGSKSIVWVGADTDPGSFYLYERATGKLSLLLRSAAWINPEQMASKQPFEFTARDGLKLQGYLSYPPGQENAKNLPMVVYVHGGPYGVRDWWDYDPDVQAMATRGYLVLQVNYRGSGGYGYDFEKAGWLQWGGKMQDDVTDATHWAIAQGIADPKRICTYGASYGGYAALEGAVEEPDLYKCAIGYVGVYDLGLMYQRGDIPQSSDGENYLKRVLGTDEKELAQHSPVDQLDRLKARVMLIVGGEDARVPAIQGENMRDALRKKGMPCEWLYKPKEAHGFYDEENVAELYAKVDAFLDANIGPGAGGSATTTATAAAH